MKPPTTPPPLPVPAKTGFWRRLGGGSLTASVVLHLSILALGALWIIRIIPPPQEKIVDFMPSGGGGGNPASQSISQQKQRQTLSRPNLSRISVTGTSSTISLPEMQDSSPMPTLSSLSSSMSGGLGGNGAGGGRGNGLGKGFGAGSGPGSDFGSSNGITFFDQEIKAQRVAFVIDFSLSMKGKREELMRDELKRSISHLAPGTSYQIIFFAGATWLTGDTVRLSADNRAATVTTTDGKNYQWSLDNGSWCPKGRTTPISWIVASPAKIAQSLSYVQDARLSWGTEWEPALDTAFRLRPAPETIFFMTDGAITNGEMDKVVRRLANRAKTHHTRINTIAMMEPNAHDSMKYLATATGGSFSIIDARGSVRKIPTDF